MMFDLILPYLIGLAIGIEPQSGAEPMTTAKITEEVGSGDTTAGRVPEDQTPTGQFTTAAEVKPILGMTQANWVAVRDFNGQDYLYFTHLLAWRCGLWDIRFGLNGAPADQILATEPCNVDTAQPNALADVENYLPYLVFPPGSIESVTVTVTYDDSTSETATFARTEIFMP
ncbi:MAG: hypothetical protein AAFQ64_03375 [Pseudomonadota bacterium]